MPLWATVSGDSDGRPAAAGEGLRPEPLLFPQPLGFTPRARLCAIRTRRAARSPPATPLTHKACAVARNRLQRCPQCLFGGQTTEGAGCGRARFRRVSFAGGDAGACLRCLGRRTCIGTSEAEPALARGESGGSPHLVDFAADRAGLVGVEPVLGFFIGASRSGIVAARSSRATPARANPLTDSHRGGFRIQRVRVFARSLLSCSACHGGPFGESVMYEVDICDPLSRCRFLSAR